MKLAEALIERKSLKGRIDQIIQRMKENVVFLEGNTHDEDFAELEKTYESMLARFESIANRINNTNNKTMLNDQYTIAEAITKRDCIKSKIAACRAVKEAVPSSRRHLSSSYVLTINMKEYQKKIDDLARQFRELDTKIQGLNWNTELL